MKRLLERLRHEERAQDLIEYALLTAAISFGSLAVIANVGAAIQNQYAGINQQVTAAASPMSGRGGASAGADAGAGTASSGSSASAPSGGTSTTEAGTGAASGSGGTGGRGNAGTGNNGNAGAGNNGNGRGNGR